MNFTQKDSNAVNTTICGMLIRSFVCPSDPQTTAYDDGGTVFGGTNYGSNDGDWYVFSLPGGTPAYAGTPSRSAFSGQRGPEDRRVHRRHDPDDPLFGDQELPVPPEVRLALDRDRQPEHDPVARCATTCRVYRRRLLLVPIGHDAHPMVERGRLSRRVYHRLATQQEDVLQLLRHPGTHSFRRRRLRGCRPDLGQRE